MGVVGVGVAVYAGAEFLADFDSYAVPTEVCGLAAPSSLEPLLPDGDELEVRDEDVSTAVNVLQMCYFVVDDEGVLTTVVRHTTVAPGVYVRHHDSPQSYYFVGFQTTIRGEPAVVGQEGALVQVPCPGLGEDRALQINVRYHAAGAHGYDQDVRNVREFTADLMSLYSDEYCG